MSDETAECTKAKDRLSDAKSETSKLYDAWRDKASKVEDATSKLTEARRDVEYASREAGAADSEVAKMQDLLRQQEQMPDYLGKDRDVDDKKERLAKAESVSKDANKKRDDAVSTSDRAESALESARKDDGYAATEHREAEKRESYWESQVRSECR